MDQYDRIKVKLRNEICVLVDNKGDADILNRLQDLKDNAMNLEYPCPTTLAHLKRAKDLLEKSGVEDSQLDSVIRYVETRPRWDDGWVGE